MSSPDSESDKKACLAGVLALAVCLSGLTTENRKYLALYVLHATGGKGHIALFNTLAIGHTKHANEQRISCHPFVKKQLRGANRQDFVFIRPPGISHGAFALRMDNIWFCKVLLLFQID
jgi:hypothetical protein